MISPGPVQVFLTHFKFMDIFISFLLATLPFIYCCKRRPRFFPRVAGYLLFMRVLCLVLAYTYDGTLAMEVPYSMIVITLLILGLMFCYDEKLWNVVFYFGSGFMTWYVTDRLFLIIASLCRLNHTLRPYFVEDTVPHMLLYVGCFAVVYLFIFFTVGKKMRQLGGSEIPMQNALLLFTLVCILTPIFYFESQVIANYDLFFYNLLNVGEIIFYVFMLMIQVLMLASAKERAEFHTMQKLWLEEQKQYRLVKENIDAINIKCHDLKHQIRSLRETGQVDPAYLDDLERSVSIYNSAVRTGNETLDIVLTDKRLHCATHGIQFTCIAEGNRMAFMEIMDIFSLFGNILDNAIECEAKLPLETRFIHLSARAVNQLLLIHVENHFEGTLELWNGIPLTTKDDKDYHGYGMLSIRHIVEKYGGNFEISTEDRLFQIDIMLPIPASASEGGWRRMTRRLLPALLCILLLCACGRGEDGNAFYCQVVLEEGVGYTCAGHVRTVPPGRDAVFSLRCADGYTIVGADCEDYNLEPNANGGITFTVHDARYSTVISLTAERSVKTICYDSNDGSGALPVEAPVIPSHLRWNTATGLFVRPGYTLTGWNTCPDGSGRRVGLGSRIEPEEGLTLYAQWAKWSPAELFRWREEQGGATITAYFGMEETAVVPGKLDGLPVRAIQAGAFENVPCGTVILPDTLYTVEDGAFRGCALRELCLFDNIRSISDPAFEGCEHLATLRLNAAEPPVYSGTYYDTFQDKFDRLSSLRDREKIVLFSGSSTRFGVDCAALDEAFPEYEIVNMGVFAYTNAMPQMELILSCMEDGDILLHCPEFDASREQFCTINDLDEPFFNMMESNYGALELLDLRRYRAVFTPLGNYLAAKDPMSKRSYALSPADFDEDGNPVDSPSYNQYGDYVVYRPNAATSLPVYGAPIHYTTTVFPKEVFLDPLNAAYRRFQEKGVSVYFDYAPRNALALSESSTPEARLELDRYLRENLCVPVITELEDSLWDGIYLYGTDNHLSTEGAAIRTQRLIAVLQMQMERDKIV